MNANVTHLLPDAMSFARGELPANFRVPFGWEAGMIAKAGQAAAGRLAWSGALPTGLDAATLDKLWLRFTVAVDVRDEKRIDIRLARSQETIASCRVRFAYVLQPFEVELDVGLLPRIQEEGLELIQLEGETPLWIFTATGDEAGSSLLLPHLLAVSEPPTAAEREARLLALLPTAASLQPFGWMEGCVLDGLLDLAKREAGTAAGEVAGTHIAAAGEGNREQDGAIADEANREQDSATADEGNARMNVSTADEGTDVANHATASEGNGEPHRAAAIEGNAEPDGVAVNGGAQRWLDGAARHLRKFVSADDELVYEDPRSRIADGTIHSIEDTLMFAALSKLQPGHKLTAQAIRYWESQRQADGSVRGGMVSAEGSYTIAYPSAVIAVAERRTELAEEAVRQLLLRRDVLAVGDDLYLRYYEDGSRTFRNWARGYAWYMQGLVRTLITLDQAAAQDSRWTALAQSAPVAELREEWTRIAGLALRLQQPDGLWPCFLGEADTGPETSGSAGIAAAVAAGARHGLNDAAAGVAAAAKARAALRGYLTPDGLLGGVTQSNRGGEPFQRSGYRVISQMGMGLYAQLVAALPQAKG